MTKLTVQPITLRKANEFVTAHHRHNKKTQGHRYSLCALSGGVIVGVAIVGRPIARNLDDGLTAEITRVCVLDDAPKNTNSFLYGRCWRVWQQMGGKRMITYTLQSESGSSLRAVNWKILGEVKPQKGGWDRDSRKREWQEIFEKKKYRWEIS